MRRAVEGVGRANSGDAGKRVWSLVPAGRDRALRPTRSEVDPKADVATRLYGVNQLATRRIISWPSCTARRSPCPASRSSTIKLYHGLAKPNASERIRHWSVNRKHCELESVAGLDFVTKYHAIGHVEALNGSRGWDSRSGAAFVR